MQLDVAVFRGDNDALQDVAQAAAVGAGVVNDGAAQGAGDAAGPLEAGVAGEGEADAQIAAKLQPASATTR